MSGLTGGIFDEIGINRLDGRHIDDHGFQSLLTQLIGGGKSSCCHAPCPYEGHVNAVPENLSLAPLEGASGRMDIGDGIFSQADVYRAFMGDGGLDGFFRFPAVRWDDDRKIGQAAHESDVFDGLMGGTVTADGQAAVTDDDFYIEIGQADGIAGDFQSPFGKQCIRSGQGDFSDGSQTGGGTHQVLFGNTDIEKPFRSLVLKFFCPRRRGDIRINDDDIGIFIDFRFQDMTVGVPCRHSHYDSPSNSSSAFFVSAASSVLLCQAALFSMKSTPLPLMVSAMMAVGMPFVSSASFRAARISSKL